jgi:hypothetical protein
VNRTDGQANRTEAAASGTTGMPHRRSRARRFVTIGLAAALVPGITMAAFRQAPADPSPASGTAKVVAQGVIDVDRGDLVWTVSTGTAQPPANAEETRATNGFLVAGDGAILVESTGNGDQTRLASGEALLTREGDTELRAALGATASPYFEIGLVPQDEAGSSEGRFTGPAFSGPGARHDLDLVGATLASTESVTVPAGAGPSLVLITRGSAEISTATGEFVPIAEGAAASIAGEITITAYDGGADVAVAVIGPAVPRLGTAPASNRDTSAAQEAGPATAQPSRPNRAATPVAPASNADADDPDGDGLTNAEESALNTDPNLADTDGDGLSDGREVNELGTLPLADDSDGDGISDFDEAAEQPAAASTSDAAVLEPVLVDEVPVASETGVDESGSAGDFVAEGELDSDGDGLSDAFEYELGTDPFNPDSDGDNASDGEEWFLGLTGPLNPDDDQDGKLDGDEINAGTDPNDPSS